MLVNLPPLALGGQLCLGARHPRAAAVLCSGVLGLDSLGGSGYFHSEQVPGTRHFGVWPLVQAAQACFGQDRWPDHLAVPQVSIEFEVADLAALDVAAEELAAAGHELLHPPREEPWGQTVARLLSPEGAIVGISFAPAMH